ncbi:NmrA family NAD(P)-binding protein [Nocardia sp. NPDC050408]|uniref:NmrA family NAD(P)-binding protein n=1 Tax=Nocardia sp. NPDC050408 TaxID=3364319 RepID=UPI0037B0C60C
MILVTGATGSIGKHLVRELRERGVPLRALVRDAAKAALDAPWIRTEAGRPSRRQQSPRRTESGRLTARVRSSELSIRPW